MEEHAEQPGAFITVQIDLDVDSFKIRDSFVWNVHGTLLPSLPPSRGVALPFDFAEKLITPDAFARIFCTDLDIPDSYVDQVAMQIVQQVADQSGIAEFALRSEAEAKEEVEKDLRVIVNVRLPLSLSSLYDRLIFSPQLDVQIGTLHLTDRLEWDLSSSLTPELFAATTVRDLSLDTNAAPIIAAALHDELFRLKRSCIEMGLIGIDDATMARRRGPKTLEGVWREWNDAMTYGPRVERLSLDELDRVEQDRERAIRCVFFCFPFPRSSLLTLYTCRRAKRDRLGAARNAPRPKK